MTRPNYLQYKVSGKLIRLLGRDSVSNATAALFELVKNSYDADSPSVTISFVNIAIVQEALKALRRRYVKISTELRHKYPKLSIKEIDELTKKNESYVSQLEYVKKRQKETKIIVEDKGTGMSLEKLQDKWMVVGVDKEEDELLTKKGRVVVGEKGVGRFAAEQLSHHMTFISNPINSSTGITAEFDWEKFTGKKTLTNQKIPVSYQRKEKSKRGLRLELTHLRDDWPKRSIDLLTSELSSLVPPKELSTKHPFSITLKIDGVKEPIEVESYLFKKAPYYFKAELTEKSTIRFVEARYKRDTIIPNTSKLDLFGMKDEFPFKKDSEITAHATCGPTNFTFYGFPIDPTGKDFGWTKFYGKINMDDFEDNILEASGVKIYRDGFRIRPYGDKDHDWVHLTSTARDVAGRLPSKRVIGWIELTTKNNPDIIDTTSREKIKESEAFEDLNSFTNQAMDMYAKYAEAKRQQVVQTQSLAEVPKLIKKLGEKIIDDASIPKPVKKELADSLNLIQIELTDKDTRSLIEKEGLMDEKNAYRNLASLGIATGVVSHESNVYLRDIISHSALLKRDAEKPKPNYKDLLQHLTFIDPSAKNLLNYMTLVKGFTSSLGSRSKEFRKKQNLNLNTEVSRIFKGMKGFFEVWYIHPEIKISKSFPKLRMFQADLQSMILNLTSNSMKSLKFFSSERRSLPKSQKNKIRITAYTDKNDVIITFSDNGLGIPESDKEFVFNLFWTRIAKRETSLSGSGLGLPIIKQIVNDYGGKILIEKKSELKSGVTFKIVIPKNEIVL